jgi:superfamily II DNA or RNA helicase
MNGFIYIRTHQYYDINQVCKLGRTKNFINRDKNYITGEFIRGHFILIIEILNYDDVFTEKVIQRYFKNYHLKRNGGIEFYNKKIIDEIIPFLEKTNIKFKVLNKKEINQIIFNNKFSSLIKLKHINNIKINIKNNKKEILNNHLKYVINNYDTILRNQLQQNYIIDISNRLIDYNRVFIKAPTGFGKTHLYYKIIKKFNFNKILFLTPRRDLNLQILDEKYSKYLNLDDFSIIHFSHNKNFILTDKFIMTSCYQSNKQLLEFIQHNNIIFDIIIFDESHILDSWLNNSFLIDNITNYRIFGSATPTETIEINTNIFGQIVEKINVSTLLSYKLLCDIETIIKQLNNQKNQYHNLKDLIIESMINFNKRKGIVYLNTQNNAKTLYKLLKKQDQINTYIYISDNIDNDFDINIKNFENDVNKSVIIAVGKISYGYDNNNIDFICLGDPRQSDIDIRQIIGRGLRWNKKEYPNKILHLLIPLYRDEFDNYENNEHLKKYLDYIIGECEKDIIFKSDGSFKISDKLDESKESNNYNGDIETIEILKEYSTTGYNKFTDFMRFLRKNNIYDERRYNQFREINNWIPEIGNIHKKYPKFCFRNIHPNNINYYWDKQEAIEAYTICDEILMIKLGKDKYRKCNNNNKLIKINELDNKIPNINFDLYYPIYK